MSFLKILQDTAERNAKVNKYGNRFSEPLKLFSLYLFIVGGRLTYETLYGNLRNCLPSLTTVERTLSESQQIKEGVIRFKELKEYLEKRNCPMKVFISEDQTAIIKNVRYDSTTNQMIGFVSTLCPETGFPVANNFLVHSFCDIEQAFTR